MKFTPTVPEVDALPERLKLLSGAETIRGTPFQAVYNTLVRHRGEIVATEAAREAEIHELRFNPLKNYPLRNFLRFEYSAARRLAPGLNGFDEAIFQLGAAAVEPFFNSVAGRTMKILSGHEPHRLFSAVPSGYQLLLNGGKHAYEKNDLTCGTFSFFGDTLGPVHNSGIFDAALRQIYGVRAEFALEQSALTDFKFRMTW